MAVSSGSVVSLTLGVLVGYLMGLATWMVWSRYAPQGTQAYFAQFDQILIGLSVLCAFALGIFLAYFLL